MLVIMYNRWTLQEGWTALIDVLLPPLKNQARLMDAYLDQAGIIHLVFVGGDNTEANLYYAYVLATQADQAPAWSTPLLVAEGPNDPSVAAIAGDDQENLVIIYSGKQAGWGLYNLYSSDNGRTWSEPEPSFLTYDELFPFILEVAPGESGLIHTIWDVRNIGGQGRQINYANLRLADRQWSDPVRLAEVDSGYGVLQPTVVEYQDQVFVAYSGVVIQQSADGGRIWSPPLKPFRQTGINGVMSFVVDSKDRLHFLWAQRISGSPDIHGVWHSVWQEGRWTEPEAVVSGPSVPDMTGNKAFDPYDVRAVASQGNVILATWRSDPGLNGNGVWYSYYQLEDAPELPVVPLPSQAPIQAAPAVEAIVEPESVAPTATATVVASPANTGTGQPAVTSFLIDNPAGPLIAASVSVSGLISLIVIWFFITHRNRI
jgi:hypothetical protein